MEPEEEKHTLEVIVLPRDLAKETQELVTHFAEALAERLTQAQKQYGSSWMSPDWMDECRYNLLKNVLKGDPVDVAAFAAFLWYHGQPTTRK